MKFNILLAFAVAALSLSGLVADASTEFIYRAGKHKHHDKRLKQSRSSGSRDHKRSSKSKESHDRCSKESRDHGSCDRKCGRRTSDDSCPGDTLRIGLVDNSNLFPDTDSIEGGIPLTILTLTNPTSGTASGFDPSLWCLLAKCVKRNTEFIGFTRCGDDVFGNFADAFAALLAGQIDVVGSTFPEEIWREIQFPLGGPTLNAKTNMLIGIDCDILEVWQNVIWNEKQFSPVVESTDSVEKTLIKLWQTDKVTFGTSSESSPAYKELRMSALAAGRSEDYFKAHVITNADAHVREPINYLSQFGPIGAADKYQVLYVRGYGKTHLGKALQKFQVAPWSKSQEALDTSSSSIKFIPNQLPINEDDSFGYILRRDCCQLIRDLQECLNAIICNGTYTQLWQNLAEIFPTATLISAFCTPPLYASFAERTVSQHCICCTVPCKPCIRRHSCELPCTPTFTVFPIA